MPLNIPYLASAESSAATLQVCSKGKYMYTSRSKPITFSKSKISQLCS
jgi:hypothetical protein